MGQESAIRQFFLMPTLGQDRTPGAFEETFHSGKRVKKTATTERYWGRDISKAIKLIRL
jgi:hypothetical protein